MANIEIKNLPEGEGRGVGVDELGNAILINNTDLKNSIKNNTDLINKNNTDLKNSINNNTNLINKNNTNLKNGINSNANLINKNNTDLKNSINNNTNLINNSLKPQLLFSHPTGVTSGIITLKANKCNVFYVQSEYLGDIGIMTLEAFFNKKNNASGVYINGYNNNYVYLAHPNFLNNYLNKISVISASNFKIIRIWGI
jgi:hypothetical protein